MPCTGDEGPLITVLYRTLDVLIESLQGPNFINQEVVASGDTISTLNRIFNTCIFGEHSPFIEEAKLTLKQKAYDVALSIMDGPIDGRMARGIIGSVTASNILRDCTAGVRLGSPSQAPTPTWATYRNEGMAHFLQGVLAEVMYMSTGQPN